MAFSWRSSLLAVSLVLLPHLSGPGLGQTSNSWLDQPLKNWNRTGQELPQLPTPNPPSNINQCVSTIRQPTIDAERAVVNKGWKLFGPRQTFDNTELFLATSGFDGMCRPMGFQAFVYVEGRYAGTLSPVLMDAREDGVLMPPTLNSATEITLEYARYRPTDPLCCPSGTSTVTFKIRPDEVPDLIPVNVYTSYNDNASTTSEPAPMTLNLTGQAWYLKQIGTREIPTANFGERKPYIEFNGSEKRYSGTGGCNRFMGGFTTTGQTLNLSPAASTKMACLEGNIQAIEDQMLQGLGNVTRYTINGNTLSLYNQDKLLLVFTAN